MVGCAWTISAGSQGESADLSPKIRDLILRELVVVVEYRAKQVEELESKMGQTGDKREVNHSRVRSCKTKVCESNK